jgi:cytochrome c oxidase subunit IV
MNKELSVSGDNKAKQPEATLKTYIAVWAGLMAFTALTVTAASLNLGGLAIIICLGIAAVKASLVLLYFMHLRYEDKLLIKLLIPIVIITLAIFIGLTYSDVITR